jgi:transposase-like protein
MAMSEDKSPKTPSTIEESVKWLINLDEEIENKKLDYNAAVKAVADKFGVSKTNLKSAIKAYRTDTAKETIDALNDKVDAIQLVCNT